MREVNDGRGPEVEWKAASAQGWDAGGFPSVGDAEVVILNPEPGQQEVDPMLNWFTQLEGLVASGD